MKLLGVASLLSVLLLTGCAISGERPNVSSHWMVKNSEREVSQARALEREGVISQLVIMESSPEQLSAFGPANVIGCLEGGGKWLQKYGECEYMRPDICEALGGTFNECSSACRHNPDAMTCIKMCVPVCSFE